MRHHTARATRRLAIGGVAALSALSLAACAAEGNAPQDPEDVTDVRGEDDLTDPFTGAYDAAFNEDMTAYVGQEVTLSASVDEVFAPQAFTITSPDGSDVDPALVVAEQAVDGLEPGQQVTVAATPFDDFELGALEARLGADLDDAAFEPFEDATYLSAGIVEPAGS